jgi:solute carrier family 25 oxoglutarate transporter 11
MIRAMSLNMGMLASNDQVKELMVGAGFTKGSPTVVMGSAAVAGVVAATFSLPFDFVKTRMQKMMPLPDGTMPYKSLVDCAVQTLKNDGVLAFYTGYPTYCIRIAPHVLLTLVIMDFLPKIQKPLGL